MPSPTTTSTRRCRSSVLACFVEFGEKLSARLDDAYHPQRYSYVAHGAGLGPEYPGITFQGNYDGVIEEHMSLSMEAYIGPSAAARVSSSRSSS
jgi:hypothetical protein